MSDIKLVAEARTEFGTGAARRTRRNNQIPAVLYGHGTDPVHVALPAHQTTLALKHSNALFTIALDGTEVLALAKEGKIKSTIKTLPFTDINDAFQALDKGQAEGRLVVNY